jgi:hypothetical protein
MSRLVHLCTECSHPKANHGTNGAVYKSCVCCRKDPRDVTFDPQPVILATFDLATHTPEPLWKPGDVRNAGTGHKEQLCGCEACQAAYARETA